jgi:phage repressor protein C with HTH and peptisase S24 domain
MGALNNYLNGGVPGVDKALAIANACNVELEWLVTGRNPPSRSSDEQSNFVGIPRYDAELSAGSGSFSERAELLDHIPFTREFLLRKVGRKSAENLAVLEVRGDSMEPTIADGDLVLIDRQKRKLADGIMAFVLDDVAYVKRIRSFLDEIEIISDNREVYPPQILPRRELDRIHIIGRVLWCGHMFPH